MSEELVLVAVGGTLFSGWMRAQVRAAVDEAARSFRFEVAAEAGGKMTAQAFKAGTKVEVYSGGDLLLTGYVDTYEPSISAREARIIVAGRSKAADLIDSSPKHKTGRFRKKKLSDIAKELDEAGVGVKVEDQDEETDWQLNPGATAFRELEQIARSKDMVLTGQADGSVKIWTPGKTKERHAGGLFLGQNILEAVATHDWSQRASEYIVRAQQADAHGVDALEIEAVARDEAVDRKRPIVIIQREASDKSKAKKRAERHRDRTAGFSLKATITTQGFRDQGGKVWEPGHLVWVEAAFLDLAQDMLIESVNYTIDSTGSRATLALVDPRAYGAKKKSKGNKSGKTWNQSSGKAEETGTGLLGD